MGLQCWLSANYCHVQEPQVPEGKLLGLQNRAVLTRLLTRPCHPRSCLQILGSKRLVIASQEVQFRLKVQIIDDPIGKRRMLTGSGYWMPFEAARAVAATFCHEIRYVLTPVFGPDFPSLCISPTDPAFKCFSVNPEIIVRCTEAAIMSRQQSRESSVVRHSYTHTRPGGKLQWTPRSQDPTSTDDEYEYETDSDQYSSTSPRTVETASWKPINVARSSAWDKYQFPTPRRTPDSAERYSHAPDRSASQREPPARITPRDRQKKAALNVPKRKRPDPEEPTPAQSKRYTESEILAAKALIELHKADRRLGERLKEMERRASA